MTILTHNPPSCIHHTNLNPYFTLCHMMMVILLVCMMWGDVHDGINCARCGGMHAMTSAMCTMWGDAHELGEMGWYTN
ncbi:Uncharacterized protein TCM_039891 [Theobroma cacao]|uniref:Uncharacterized protein n=1 Tax=Theobroma cacao TaxID=3641 RepID=A0A061GSX1_THECC|nr:Uncharacterized protein TCM_039891 [Theobroma cacao]